MVRLGGFAYNFGIFCNSNPCYKTQFTQNVWRKPEFSIAWMILTDSSPLLPVLFEVEADKQTKYLSQVYVFSKIVHVTNYILRKNKSNVSGKDLFDYASMKSWTFRQ